MILRYDSLNLTLLSWKQRRGYIFIIEMSMTMWYPSENYTQKQNCKNKTKALHWECICKVARSQKTLCCYEPQHSTDITFSWRLGSIQTTALLPVLGVKWIYQSRPKDSGEWNLIKFSSQFSFYKHLKHYNLLLYCLFVRKSHTFLKLRFVVFVSSLF